ncbi:MAG: hypothetical protein ACQESR_23405 [Planctomycetota bacterium]
MATENSAQHDSTMADERTVRSFLERAAPIILESEELDGPRFQTIRALADDYGLTPDQLACELRLLQQRGVISSAPWDQFEDAATVGGEGKGTASGNDTVSDAGPASNPSEGNRREAAGAGGTEGEEFARYGSAGAVPGSEPVDISTASQAIRALEQRARKIIARRGALSPRTRRKLEKAARQAGLSESQIASVLDSVTDQPGAGDSPPAVYSAEPPSDSRAVRSSPSSTTRSPSELFRRWIDQKLSGYPSSILAIDDENGLVGVGIHRYHLASVLATHLVRDIATERGIRLERDLEDASCNSTVAAGEQASAEDQKLHAFFEEVAPILARHRGITSQSRVLMNAVAERLGLTQGELERALATLQQGAPDQQENDPRQLERRESFRAYLRRAMAHLPNGIITFKNETRLCQAGEHFHGVAPQWIKPTIKEVASEIGTRFVSKQDAIEHVTALVESQLSATPVIGGATRTRIYAEGTQWGLEPMDIDSILRRRSEMLRRQLSAERRRSRWVINFVVSGFAVAAVTVLAMLLWNPLNAPVSRRDTSPGKAQEPPAVKRRTAAPWWDDTSRIALARLRITRSDLRPVLKDLVSDQAHVRKKAYAQLLGRFTRHLPERNQKENVQQLLASLHALEPSDEAAEALSAKVVHVFESLDEGTPGPSKLIDAMLWNCQIAAAMATHPEISLPRRKHLMEQLEESLFATGDPPMETEALERFYAGALAKRLYQRLTRAAANDPEGVGESFHAVHALARRWLDSPVLDQLVAEFLASILPVVEGQRRQLNRYGPAIRWISDSSDPNTIIKLLNVYRQTTDESLRDYLSTLFYDRLGARPGTLTEAEMIQEIRESLGIAARERKNRRWNMLAETAETLLGREASDSMDPEQLVQETIELAHAATLACALTRGEAGEPVLEELEKEGPKQLGRAEESASLERPRRYESPYPLSERNVLEEHIRSLNSEVAAVKRIDLLRKIADQTTSVPDIDLRSGQRLAEYLVRSKANEQERQTVLQYAQQLGNWDAVRLGLADQLLETESRATQLSDLFSRVLDGTVKLATRADRDKVRQRLLSQTLKGLSEARRSGGAQYPVFDNASRVLLELHASQAKLLGVPSDRYASADQPSGVIHGLVNYFSEQLDDESLEAEQRALVDSLSYRLKALEFVAENDLQRTAALQQLWLQILAMRMIQEHPEKATGIRQVLKSHDKTTQVSFHPRHSGSGNQVLLRAAKSSREVEKGDKRVFEQLRDVHADLLRVWMQLRPKPDDAKVEKADI